MKKPVSFLLILLLMLQVAVPSVYAGSMDPVLNGTSELPFDGYLFQLEGGVSLSTATTASEEIKPLGNGMYQTDSLDAIKPFAQLGLVEVIEPNYIVSLLQTDVQNQANWGYEAVRAASAAAIDLTGGGIRIGIIDSGVTTSSSLTTVTGLETANILPGKNYLSGAGIATDTSDRTVDQHGTSVTQIIAASSASLSFSGIALGAEIVPLKCFDTQVTSFDVLIAAINDAVSLYQCDVINMSWGTTTNSELMQQAIANAISAGAIVVAAAGNDGNSSVLYPAGYPGVIGVGAVDQSLSMASFSQKNSTVDFCAPGVSINGKNGTSFSTPFTAGIVALMLQKQKSENPGQTKVARAEQVKSFLPTHAMDLGTAGYDTAYGFGFLRLDWLLSSGHWQQAITSTNAVTVYGGVENLSTSAMRLMAALYNLSGRMVSLQSIDVQTETKPYRFQFSKPSDLARIELFYLREDFVPRSTHTAITFSSSEIAYTSEFTADASKSYTISYDAAVAGKQYVLIIVEDNSASTALSQISPSAANITYLGQQTASGSTLTFSAIQPKTYTGTNKVFLNSADMVSPVYLGTLGSVAVSDQYAVNVNVKEDNTATYGGLNTVLMEYQIKTGSRNISNLQTLNLVFDLSVFDWIQHDGSNYVDRTSSLSGIMQDWGTSVAAFTYDGWSKSIYAAKSGNKGYLSLQVSRAAAVFSGLSAVTPVKMLDFRLGLKSGKTIRDIQSDSVRLFTSSELQTWSQDAIATLTDGTTKVTYGDSVYPDSLARPTLTGLCDGYSYAWTHNAGSGTYAFPDKTAGYGSQTGLDVTVTNTGNGTIAGITISNSNDSKFTVSKTTLNSLTGGGNDRFTITPKTGLSASTYTATITVSSANIGITSVGSLSLPVSFKVTEAPVVTSAPPVAGGGGGGGGGGVAPIPAPIMPPVVPPEVTPAAVVTPTVIQVIPNHNFIDVPEQAWYNKAIKELAAKGIMEGVTTSTFEPLGKLTRAQVVAILAKMSGDAMLGETASVFHDVKPGAWYLDYVTWAYKKGIVQGSNGNFNPGEYISRQDLAVMLDRYLSRMELVTLLNTGTRIQFTDAARISGYASHAVATMQQAGVIHGYQNPDGNFAFAPRENTTRAEASNMIYQLLLKIPAQK